MMASSFSLSDWLLAWMAWTLSMCSCTCGLTWYLDMTVLVKTSSSFFVLLLLRPTVSTTGMPMASSSFFVSILMPRRLASSCMLRSMRSGMPCSKSWTVKKRLRSMFELSTTSMTRSSLLFMR